MWPFYKLLPNLPKPPQELLDEYLIDPKDFPSTTPLHEVRIRHCTRKGEKFLASKGVRIPVKDEFTNWVKKNITDQFTDVGANYRHCNSDTGGIHTDTTRDFALSYNIINGGPNCRVVFWQEHNQPLERERGIQHLDFDVVTPAFELPPGPDNVWFFHNTTMLHSVEGLSSPRIQVTVGFLKDQVPKVWLT